MDVSDTFRKLAAAVAAKVGTAWAFMIALAVIIVWAVTGPLFDFSETWQLIINTSTTIVTFLMVFVIQATQNRDAKAIHLKLDELIRSSGARELFEDIEDATEEEIDALQKEFMRMRQRRPDREESEEPEERASTPNESPA